jgi:dienelactone hydrolase
MPGDSTHPSRRDLLKVGLPTLAGAALAPQTLLAADTPDVGTSPAVNPAELPWPERRNQIERGFLDLLGEFPKQIPPLETVMKKVAEEDGITRYHVSFQAEPGDRVTAWLLVPKAAEAKPTPAIIVIHSTTWGAGKNSTAGLSGRRLQDPPTHPDVGRASGLELARHGYVVLCIDLLTDGERIPPGGRVMDTRWFYEQNPEWSIIGKNIWDVSRCVDFLHTLDFVDRPHIGVIGWSLGGHQALFCGAFDDRITATVSNGGVLDWHLDNSDAWSRKPASWTPWKQGDPETSSKEIERRFGFKTNSGPYIYIKKFRKYVDDKTLTPAVDFDDLMAMVAPRPLLIISSEQEFYRHRVLPKCLKALPIFLNWQDAPGLPSAVLARQQRLGYDKTLEYYETQHRMDPKKMPDMLRQLGAGDCLSWFSFPGGHAYPPVARRYTEAWYDRWLGFEPAATT